MFNIHFMKTFQSKTHTCLKNELAIVNVFDHIK
jgi:hypothetical protein